ncbi:MAG: hypothetical protein P8I61_03380 [Opitutae bacterium]|nr:hypothetical protein [Opitutae bacterium]
MNKSNLLFYASLLSVILSIGIWMGIFPLCAPENYKISAVFVGLWAPTLMSMSNRYKS